MARRNKKSVFEDLIDVTALMPWWVGTVLAFVSYFMLHALATRPPPIMATAAQVSDGILHVFISGLAMGGQYLLPFVFSIGALVSFFKRRKAGQLHDSAAHRADGIARMSWREFETLVGEYFRRQSFTVVDNDGGGPDGGVDVRAQAAPAPAPASRATGNRPRPIRPEELAPVAEPAARSTPSCPLCSVPMVLRQARNGAAPRKQFWGCSSYAQTKCRGTRELAS